MSEVEAKPAVLEEKGVGSSPADPESLEVSAGFRHENLEGWIPELAGASETFDALEKAFDYRGDITITRRDGTRLDGYVFDRKPGKTLEDSFVRLYPANSNQKLSISYSEVARLEFGKDRAAGKHWEDWVAQYQKKKAAGEKNIGIAPETLE